MRVRQELEAGKGAGVSGQQRTGGGCETGQMGALKHDKGEELSKDGVETSGGD